MAAGAQTSVTLVSNTGQTGGSQLSFFDFDAAQPFTTGPNPSGYTLTEVMLNIDVFGTGPSAPQSLVASICSAPASGPADAACFGTLTVPSAPADGLNSYAAGDEGIKLSANTTYLLLLDGGAGLTKYSYLRVSSRQLDSGGAAGWSLADVYHENNNHAPTDDWFTETRHLQLAIHGFPNPPIATQPNPDPSNLARSDVQWDPVGGTHPLPTKLSEISSNKPKQASASLDLSNIGVSVMQELRPHSRGFYLTTQVLRAGARPHLFRLSSDGARYVVAGERMRDFRIAPGSPLLLVKIWHVYHHVGRGTNTVERLGGPWYPRRNHQLSEPVEACLPAPARDAERARIAVRLSGEPSWIVLETVEREGQLCARTVRVDWFIIVLVPAEQAA
ncbi:MAG: hypothetical protein F4X58_01065 [Chloroflexi bacterium]|nr:hypothetical protein [Chloroflexota bacterium]MYC00496.1 hypothetical protein [Chloroflexota bacterium]